jgi:hypothetical protein
MPPLCCGTTSRKHGCWTSYCDKNNNYLRFRQSAWSARTELRSDDVGDFAPRSRSIEIHPRRRTSKSTLQSHLDMSPERLSTLHARIYGVFTHVNIPNQERRLPNACTTDSPPTEAEQIYADLTLSSKRQHSKHARHARIWLSEMSYPQVQLKKPPSRHAKEANQSLHSHESRPPCS